MDKPLMTVYIDGSERSERVLGEIKEKFGDKYRIERFYREGSSEEIPAVATATSLIEGYDNVRRYILGPDKDTGEKTAEKKNEQEYLIELGMPTWTLQGGGYAQPIEISAKDDVEAFKKARDIVKERIRLKQEVPSVRVSKVLLIIENR